MRSPRSTMSPRGSSGKAGTRKRSTSFERSSSSTPRTRSRTFGWPKRSPARRTTTRQCSSSGPLPASFCVWGRRDDASLKVVERLLQIQPDPPHARIAAELYLARNGPTDAMQALAKLQVCFQANRHDLDTLGLLARAFTQIGQAAKAIEVQKEMARIARDTHRGDLFAELLTKLQKLAPNDEGVKQLAAAGMCRRRLRRLASQTSERPDPIPPATNAGRRAPTETEVRGRRTRTSATATSKRKSNRSSSPALRGRCRRARWPRRCPGTSRRPKTMSSIESNIDVVEEVHVITRHPSARANESHAFSARPPAIAGSESCPKRFGRFGRASHSLQKRSSFARCSAISCSMPAIRGPLSRR